MNSDTQTHSNPNSNQQEFDSQSVDQDLEVLSQKKDEWARRALSEKITLLEKVLKGIGEVAEAQVDSALQAKGLGPQSPCRGEEWLGGPMVQARITRQLIEALRYFDQEGHTGIKSKDAYIKPNGQVAVRVFPKSMIDKLSFQGFRAEVYLQPQVSQGEWYKRTALFYRTPAEEGTVSLVLGAGNVASIGLLDALYKLFVEGQVCYLKFNPVNEYLEPHYTKILQPLIDQGYVRMGRGDGRFGAYLCQHPIIDEIHVTGSDKTHDAIVYGVGEEGAARKERDEPICDKRITSELGNVSPVIIVPGSWTQRELIFHAENVATQMTNNAGFNCNAARVLILQKSWSQRRAFLDALRGVLARLGTRPAYYPGAQDRFDRFMGSHSNSERFGEEREGCLPWGLLVDVDSNDHEHMCFTQESFCGLAAQTTLDSADAGSFLQEAVQFANERLWGTLSASIIIHPKTEKSYQTELDAAIQDLKYGSVCINHWPALSYGMGVTTWGAYPGHTRQDIQSGVGVVHNTYLLEDVEKTVIYGPFIVKPRPPWFVTHKRGEEVGRALTTMELSPSLSKFPRLLWGAIRG